MIKFEDVTKEYSDGTHALDGVSFAVNSGEFVFVVGSSGSGKTTLMKLILREELPTKGTLFFEDLEVPSLKDRQATALRRQIGMVFQEFKLIPSRTVLENVTLPLRVIREKEAAEERALEVLTLVGLSDRAQLFPKNLSGGEKQRVSFARALIHRPRLLLADEPTGNIDQASSEKVCEVLAKINEAGTTVLVATHDLAIVKKMKRRVLELEEGKVVRDAGRGNS